MPKLIELYIRQVLIGFGLSAVFVGLLLYTNVGNLWHLVTNSNMGIVAVIMLFMANGIIFAGAQFAFTILRMAEDEDDSSGGKRQPEPVLEPALIPIPVRADDRR